MGKIEGIPSESTKPGGMAMQPNIYAKVWTIAATAVLLISGIARAQAPNVEGAKKEASVVLYGTATPQAMDVINKGFEKKYGIRVEYWRASATGVADRALNEWRAGRPGFDVVEASRGVQLIMQKAGLF